MTETQPAVNVAGFNRRVKLGTAKAEQHLPALERAYARLIRDASREAARDFRSLTAAANPDWQPPPSGTILGFVAQAAAIRDRLQGVYLKVVREVQEPALQRLGISFDITHPITADLLSKAGARAGAALGEAIQPVLVKAVAQGYADGLSVDDTAKLIQADIADAADWQAKMLARTDLNSLANGGSVAAARQAGLTYKTWLTAGDEKVREEHQAADGQTVPVDQPFTVGGESLDYPGDPAASDGETINCRCTVIYADSLTSSANGGGTMTTQAYAGRIPSRGFAKAPGPPQLEPAERETLAVAAGVRWQAVLAVEGEPTDDGRMMAPGSITWRDLPLSLMAQTQTLPGHDGAEVAGRIDTIWRDGSKIMGAGVFDTGEFGIEITRLVQEQTLRGVSVDLAVREFEVRILDENGDPGAEMDPEMLYEMDAEALYVVTDGVIGAATVCAFQAIDNATITIVGSSNDQWLVAREAEFAFPGPTVDDRIAAAVGTLAHVTEMQAKLKSAEDEKRSLRLSVAELTDRHREETQAQKLETLAMIEGLTARIASGEQVTEAMLKAVADLSESTKRPRSVTVVRGDDGRPTGYEVA